MFRPTATDNPWDRLSAVIAIDELGDQARSAIPALKKANQDSNHYVVRVSQRALQKLNTNQAKEDQ